MKTMSFDSGIPKPIDIPNVASVGCSAEHGTIKLDSPSDTPRVGDKIQFIVGYGDTTVFLHDNFYGTRDGRVEVVWPILGRGKLQ
jgi:D-serine deaminase-like pyridoxal phosphate-dependent protein